MTATDKDAQTYVFVPPERLEVPPRFAEVRRDQPLSRIRMPYGQGEAWLASRYQDVRTVNSDPRFSRAGTVGRNVPRQIPVEMPNTWIMNMDPPDHTRLRRLVSKAFTPGRVERLRAGTQQMMDELLDEMLASGSPADLVEAIAWPLPIAVICELLGVPVVDRAKFRAWTEANMAVSAARQEEIVEARTNLRGYLAELVAQRRVEPTDDLLGLLVAARDEQDRLTELELVQFGSTLLNAGYETTASEIGNFVYTLLAQGKWQLLVDDPGLVPKAVEELLRYIPFVLFSFPSVALEDVELSGQLVRAGETVLAAIASGNRDESIFDHPDELNFTRDEIAHLTFGYGVHYCLGAPLARQELQIAIETLVRRVPTLRLAVPADEVPWATGRLLTGLSGLSVAW